MNATAHASLKIEALGTGPRTVLVLHGGAGPFSVRGLAERIARELDGTARVLAPTHPGFDGTPRPAELNSVAALADRYAELVGGAAGGAIVVGSSIGGWIAAELALRVRLAGLVLIGATGIDVPGEQLTDFFSLTPADIAKASYHDPAKFAIDPSKLTDAQRASFAGNRAALGAYAGSPMYDTTLRARLGAIAAPTLCLWGEADRIVTPAYGRAYAAAIPNARFELAAKAGHLPQLETPDETVVTVVAAIREFDRAAR
jgi:pimeloyl-ACP methyl ester carboxylesterase